MAGFSPEFGRVIIDHVEKPEPTSNVPAVPKRTAPVVPGEKRAVLNSTLAFEDSATAVIKFYNNVEEEDQDGSGEVTVYDWCLDSGETLPSGTKVTLLFDNGRWFVKTFNKCPE